MHPAPEAGATTPTELRLAVLRNGWSPLPVAGKRPTLDDWPKYCRSPATDHEIAFWGRSHGGAVSTGLALGHQAGIDIDVLSDPALAAMLHALALDVFGPTPFVRVGRAPKLALVYRAGADVVSASYKAASGNGDGLDILAGGRQIVGFGRHAETGLPYTWVGDASPLDARPEAAPVITADQVAEFIVRVEAIMPLGGGAGGSRRGGGGGGASTLVRNAAGLVSDGREGFLFGCVWRAANDLHQAKVELTAEALTEAAWAFFADPTRGAALDDGRWRRADAAYRAKLTLRRLEAGTVELGARVEADDGAVVAPTYPDTSVPVDEARAAIAAAMAGHFAAGAGQRALRISTGCGKTRAAVKAVAADVQHRRGEKDKSSTLYLAPRIDLADEVRDLFRAEGVTAETFRGRSQPDPDAEGFAMCLDLEAVELAVKLDLTVSTSCCKLKDQTTGQMHHCPFYGSCGYQRQINGEAPDVWVASHEMLFTAPSGLGEVGSLVVDEGFASSGLKIGTRGLTLDEVGTQPAPSTNKFEELDRADIAAWRSIFKAALGRQEGVGGVERRHLVEGGLTAEICAKAGALEWRAFDAVAFWPGMGKDARQAAARAAVAKGRIGRITSVWRAARGLLEQEDEGAVSGRLVLIDKETEDGFGKARAVLVHGLKPVLKRWLGIPVLLMDATLPPVEVLRHFFPDVEIVADVESTAPHATVRQVVGAPVSSGKLLKSEAGRNREAVRRAILLRWVQAKRPSTLVVAQKAMAEWLRNSGLPEGITTGHYGALSGLDGFKDVGLLIAIGRAMPDVFEVETYAGAMTGLEPLRTEMPAKGARFHDRVPLALRMAGGTGRAIEGYRHPDPLAEAARWQVAEGGVLQAVGRARGVNRAAENKVEIEIWSDLALPLTVDEVVRWDNVPAGREADMAADGIVLESAPDMAACWPAAWETARAAETWRQRFTGTQTPIESILYRALRTCGFRYQRAGARQKWRRCWYDPAVVADPRAWLEARLGRLEGFEYVVAES